MRELEPGTAWAEAVRRAAAILYRAGARAVWLFGSRVRSRPADRLSDTDLCVEGLPAGAAALAQAAAELRGNVDIVRLEEASPVLRWGIAYGRVFVPFDERAPAAPRRPPLPDSLAGDRVRAVAARLREIAPRSVLDLGCGAGWLLAELQADPGIERLTGVDFDPDALAAARARLARARPGGRAPVDLRHGLVTHRDPALLGHDAVAAIEVMEHLEPPQLQAFARVVLDHVRPRRAVLTTPNSEYNAMWFSSGRRRHPDHRFEWTRAELAAWAEGVAAEHGYRVSIEGVGPPHPRLGPPTQLARFERG